MLMFLQQRCLPALGRKILYRKQRTQAEPVVLVLDAERIRQAHQAYTTELRIC